MFFDLKMYPETISSTQTKPLFNPPTLQMHQKKCTAKMQRHFLRQLWGRKKKNIDTSVSGTLELIGVNYGMSASF